MAIIYSYPDNENLLLTDMLIGTSTIKINGRKKNITKNFTLEALGLFIQDNFPAANVQWGNITGTLSNQVDLQAALNAKQGNITLTTTGGTGPATFIGNTLNIPDYSTGYTVPTLQSVTDEGDTTTTTVYLNGGAISNSINEQAVFAPASISTVNVNSGSGATLDSTGSLSLSPDGLVSALFAANNITQSITLETPNKASGSYTLATVDDIPSVTGYVPYTGANQNVDLGEYELKAGQLTLDTTPTGTSVVGTTQWNDATGVSETKLKGGNVVLKNGVDLVARVVNKVTPNATLLRANYTAVRISGAQGQRLAVAYAQANNDNNSADTIGLVCENIATNQEGFIMTMGQFEEINTTGSLQGETWADGDVLYLSPTTAGQLTNIKPTGLTGHIVVMGYVEYAHAIHGKIYVKIMNGWELDELHNVYINSPLNNDGLFYDSADSLWKNKTIAAALGYTPENVANKSTSTSLGTSDTLYPTQNAVKVYADTKFTLPSLTSGSVLFSNGTTIAQDNANFFWDDTNNRLGIGTNAPNSRINALDGTVAEFKFNSGLLNLTPTLAVGNTGASGKFAALIAGTLGSIFAFDSSGYFDIGTETKALYTSNSLGNPSTKLRVFSNGNVIIQNGGTFTDAGFRLDVNGTARVSGELTVNGVNIGLGGGAITTNTRAGLNAGQSNTTGAYNSFFGRSAGQSNTTGANNSFFGVNAGFSNTTGNSNSFFGLNAGFNNTTGASSNSFFGVNAGLSNTTGSSNSFFGQSTGLSNTTGSSNSFFGQSAGSNTTIGSNNSFVGTSAGRYIADGITNLTAVDNSVFLGNNTRANTNSETNQIVIGYNAIGIGSNSVVLGNDSITKTALKGNVLIGTTTDAGYRLDVNGTARVQGNLTINNFANILSGDNYTSYETFRTTFGTTANTLSGQYGFNFNDGGGSGTQTSGTTGRFQLSSRFAPTSGTAVYNTFILNATINQTGGANGITRGLYINPTLTSAADFRAIQNTVGKVCLNTTSGNTMIGTTTDAGFKLDVNGTARVSGTLSFVNGSQLNESGTLNSDSRLTIRGGQSGAVGSISLITLTTNANITSTFGNPVLVGITRDFAPTSGTATYAFASITGAINQTGGANGITRGLYINPTLTAAADFRAIETTVGNVMLNTTSGNTLIGTSTNAGYKLDVNGSVRTTGSISAASALARATYLNQTLVATANNDTLIGLDIQSTFTNGAFTGVTNYLLRAGAGITLRNDGSINWGNSLSNNNRGILTWDTNRAIVSGGTASTSLDLAVNLTTALKLFTSRSVMVQNGGTFTEESSSQFTINSTARGFLPPRMTTTQKNAIATPAAGLVVYDTTLNKLCVYTTAWETITSL